VIITNVNIWKSKKQYRSTENNITSMLTKHYMKNIIIIKELALPAPLPIIQAVIKRIVKK